jgi:hypothetical protein
LARSGPGYCREHQLVEGEQDPLALLLAQAVRYVAVAAFTAIQAVLVTRKLPPRGGRSIFLVLAPVGLDLF